MAAMQQEQRREARLARQLAARADRPTRVDVTTTVGDLQVGDYLVVVPTQQGVRGVRFDTTVLAVTTDWETWTMRTGPGRRGNPGWPVEARKVKAHDSTWCWPADFTCTVQRVAQ